MTSLRLRTGFRGLPLDDVPLYNGDLERERLPDPVRALRTAIAQSDGIVLCSPGYNHGMSGVLKNALDWASRPAFNSPLKNKACRLMTSSPRYVGGACAQAPHSKTNIYSFYGGKDELFLAVMDAILQDVVRYRYLDRTWLDVHSETYDCSIPCGLKELMCWLIDDSSSTQMILACPQRLTLGFSVPINAVYSPVQA